MLFSLLANIIGIYGLITLPYFSHQLIDLSQWEKNNSVQFYKTAYQPQSPIRQNNNSVGMKVTAQAAIIVDKQTMSVLWQKNPDVERSLASITKLITALVFLEHNPGWQTEVVVQASDYRVGGRAYVYAGEKILVKDLFNASLVASSNSATVALARSTGLAPEAFVTAMNAKAKELGMAKSLFTEPTGLDPDNISTARDVAALAVAAFDKPEIKSATQAEEYTLIVQNNKRREVLKNTDKLLNSYLNVLAGKTGYLDEAGYCLVSNVAGAGKSDILVVVLGSKSEPDRFQDLKSLAQWAFDNYHWPI
ncbi:MAG: serine hydrolase [Patescibacteria group bacterium]|jgi:D-alanyl-D-alanine carboxypeptidase